MIGTPACGSPRLASRPEGQAGGKQCSPLSGRGSVTGRQVAVSSTVSAAAETGLIGTGLAGAGATCSAARWLPFPTQVAPVAPVAPVALGAPQVPLAPAPPAPPVPPVPSDRPWREMTAW